MRRRETLLYAGLALLVLAFLIYSPVLYMWWTRNEHVLTSPYEKAHYGYDRQVMIGPSWPLVHLPRFYGRLITIHASWHGWLLQDSLPLRGVYYFAPDTPEVRENLRRKGWPYPPIGEPGK